MTFSREDSRTKITVRVSDGFEDRITEYAEEHGKTKSDVIREAVAAEIGERRADDYGITPPAEKPLREAWEALNDVAGDSPVVDRETAVTTLAKRQQLPKSAAKNSLLKPLQRRGYVTLESDFSGENVVYRLRRAYNE